MGFRAGHNGAEQTLHSLGSGAPGDSPSSAVSEILSKWLARTWSSPGGHFPSMIAKTVLRV